MDEEFIKKQKHKRKIKTLIIKASFMAILLIVSTYAWFTSQKDITLSNIRGTVEVVENMEISLDAKTWYQKIDLSQAKTTFTEAQNSRDEALNETSSLSKSSALSVVPEQLFPVSGIGEIGEVLMPLYKGEATSTSLSNIQKCAEEGRGMYTGADVSVDNGYFAFDIYIKNTSRDSEADVLQLNINSSAQVITETIVKTITDVTGNRVSRTYNGNDSSGLQNTIRVALAKYEGEISSTATQVQILNSTNNQNIKDIAIWEPNAYDHVESIVANNNKLVNGVNGTSIPFSKYNPAVELDTYALNEDSVGTQIENVYNIKSTGLSKQNTLKTDNIKNVYKNVESYRIFTMDEKPVDITDVDGNLFEISANTVTRYRVYVWLEGQDVDCINIASLGGGIEIDLGLTKDDEIGDVLANADTRVSYNITNPTTESVTATITLEKEISELPDGWEYVDGTNETQIYKTYLINTIEQVPITYTDGEITQIEVTVANIDTLASKVAKNKNAMYGAYTNYPVDIDGNTDDNDWQIFYTKNNEVFLIADDYVLNSKLVNNEMSKNATVNYTTYGTYFGTSQLVTTSITSDIASKFLLTRAVPTTNQNYYATAHLLNTSVWNTYFLDNTYASNAVGGATVEMFMRSWNEKFAGLEDFSVLSYAWESNNKGYLVYANGQNGFYTDIINGFDKSEAKMYFPHTTIDNIDGTENGDCNGYWLASPSGYNITNVLYVFSSGRVNANVTNFGSYSVRPVIALNDNIQANFIDGAWVLGEN